MTKSNIEIKVNYDRAVEVAKTAINMLEKKLYPFNQMDVFPDAIIPEGVEKGSYEHALYLFYSVPLDSRRESISTYRRVRTLFKHLNFTKLPYLEINDVRKALTDYFEKNIESAAGNPLRIFVENSKKLKEHYNNDPRKIKKPTVEETLNLIRKEFFQYGKTNNALLLKNMVKAGIWDFPHNGFPIKIDRHAINLSIGTGVISMPENLDTIRFEKLVNPLNTVYKKVIKQENISAIDLNDAFWAIGQFLCTPRKLVNCQMNCPLNCEIKPSTDKQYTTIQLKKETRDKTGSLFKF